jgi:hypothetical protein
VPEKRGVMILRLNGDVRIDNLRNYSEEVVRHLSQLLTRGVHAAPDPKRPNFYDLDDGARSFYIHISPVTHKVFLLAAWVKSSAPSPVVTPRSSNHLASQPCCMQAG